MQNAQSLNSSCNNTTLLWSHRWVSVILVDGVVLINVNALKQQWHVVRFCVGESLPCTFLRVMEIFRDKCLVLKIKLLFF